MFLVSVNTLAVAVACARQQILQKGFYSSTATVHLVWKTGQKKQICRGRRTKPPIWRGRRAELFGCCGGRQNGRRADSLIYRGKLWIMFKEKPLYIVNRPSAMQAGPNPLSVMQDVWKPCARQRASQTETPIYHGRRWIVFKEKIF